MKYSDKFKESLTGEPLQLLNGGEILVGSRDHPCVWCKEPTVFVDVCCEGHICSDECNNAFYEVVSKPPKEEVSE